MPVDLSALTAYTDENKMPLIRQSLLSPKTISLLNVQPNIKTSAPINIFSHSPIFQAGACGWNASGTTVLTQRVLSVDSFKLNYAECVDTYEEYYTQTLMNPGSYNTELPIEQLYSEEIAAKTAKAIEIMAWQGNKSTGSGNNALTDGLIKYIDEEVGVVTGTALAMDAANIVAGVDEMVASISEDVVASDDLILAMGFPEFRIYMNALKQANMYHIDSAEGSNWEYTVHGTNVKVVAVAGLNGLGRMFLTEASNLHMGTDMVNDSEQFSIRYSDDNDEVRILLKAKLGFQIAFPSRIVSN
jgi:hypothetical protein